MTDVRAGGMMMIIEALKGRRVVKFPNEAHARFREQTCRCAPTEINSNMEYPSR